MDRMKRHVIELVRNVVNEYASTAIPTFDEICSGLGLNVVENLLPDRKEGMHVEKTIFIDSRMQNEERKRFTQFHEVTHFLLEKDGDLISELHEYTYSQANGYKPQLEYFCNIGAAEFLMPSIEFVKLYEKRGFNVQLIPFAAEHFKSSTIAATIQLAQVAPNKCIAVVCENELIPHDTTPSQAEFFPTENRHHHNTPKLCVIYSASSPAASDRWLSKYTVVPADHIINQAFSESKALEDESHIPFPSWQEPCICEALPYKQRVYAVFHLSPLPHPNQTELF